MNEKHASNQVIKQTNHCSSPKYTRCKITRPQAKKSLQDKFDKNFAQLLRKKFLPDIDNTLQLYSPYPHSIRECR